MLRALFTGALLLETVVRREEYDIDERIFPQPYFHVFGKSTDHVVVSRAEYPLAERCLAFVSCSVRQQSVILWMSFVIVLGKMSIAAGRYQKLRRTVMSDLEPETSLLYFGKESENL